MVAKQRQPQPTIERTPEQEPRPAARARHKKEQKPSAPYAMPAIIGGLGLCLVLGLLAAGGRSLAKRAQTAAKTPANPVEEPLPPQPMEAGAFGSVTGHLVPADGGAVVHFYKRDGSAPKYAFADPNSGAFTVPELPVDVYRVVVRPENPALEPRVIDDVVVPWGDRNDIGEIDLRPEGERYPVEDGETASFSGD